MKDIYIVEAVRTGIARAGKRSWFTHLRADDMSALVMNEAIRRAGLEDKKEMIDDVIWGGTALMKDMGSNIGRYAGIVAGLPHSVPGCTVARLCSSGLQSLAFAVASINMGWSDLILAGGAQHMTHIPMGTMSEPNPRLSEFTDPQMVSMGYTAEMVARKYGITRQEQDEMAEESHAKAHEETVKGLIKDDLLPIEAGVPQEDGSTKKMIVDRAQGIRPESTMETLAKLEPVFIKDEKGTVTAGNSSQTNDAAACLIVESKNI